ncbi:4-hydroxy-3-methylbut-2-enyl diphosphate reductase [Candidatus Omnitrophota bacterium]
MELFLAKTQGFCAGVSYAVTIVEKALKKYGKPLYVYHDIVHNTYVVENFKKQGVVFVECIDLVPEGHPVVFSAHGVPPSVIDEAKERHLKIIDATCPLVQKVHQEAMRFSKKKYHTILIGKRGHQELIGTSGYVQKDLLHIVEDLADINALTLDPQDRVAYITQTTLSVDETKCMIERLEIRFPHIVAPQGSDVCYATQNRQNAIKELARFCDVIIVCGSPNSSNSNRLKEIGVNEGVESIIIDSVKDLDLKRIKDKRKIGISSGASVPRVIVNDLIKYFSEHFPDTVIHTFNNPEKKIKFHLPKI